MTKQRLLISKFFISCAIFARKERKKLQGTFSHLNTYFLPCIFIQFLFVLLLLLLLLFLINDVLGFGFFFLLLFFCSDYSSNKSSSVLVLKTKYDKNKSLTDSVLNTHT